MTEIFKAESPKILQYIAEKLEKIEGIDLDRALDLIVYQLASKPESTGVFVIFENGELKAFIFGWYNDIMRHGWMQYAWADAELKREYKRELFDKFEDWSKSLGAEFLKASTQRTNAKAWTRLYELKEESITLSKEI